MLILNQERYPKKSAWYKKPAETQLLIKLTKIPAKRRGILWFDKEWLFVSTVLQMSPDSVWNQNDGINS